MTAQFGESEKNKYNHIVDIFVIHCTDKVRGFALLVVCFFVCLFSFFGAKSQPHATVLFVTKQQDRQL